MQHFDLYNRYNILITISQLLKFLFREPRFHLSSPSSPFPSLSRLKTLKFPIELLAHLAFFAFEVPDPDVFDTVICFNSVSSSSELIINSSLLITISGFQLFIGPQLFPLLLQSLCLVWQTLHPRISVQTEGIVQTQAHVLRQAFLQYRLSRLSIVS